MLGQYDDVNCRSGRQKLHISTNIWLVGCNQQLMVDRAVVYRTYGRRPFTSQTATHQWIFLSQPAWRTMLKRTEHNLVVCKKIRTSNCLGGWKRSLTGPVTVVLVADGSMWLVRWLRNFVVQLQSGHVEPVECQSLQITDADDLRWQ